jgi:hypothetical protein
VAAAQVCRIAAEKFKEVAAAAQVEDQVVNHIKLVAVSY